MKLNSQLVNLSVYLVLRLLCLLSSYLACMLYQIIRGYSHNLKHPYTQTVFRFKSKRIRTFIYWKHKIRDLRGGGMISNLAMHSLWYERVGLICKLDDNLISSAREGSTNKAVFTPSGIFKLPSKSKYIMFIATILDTIVIDPAGWQENHSLH